MTDFLPLILLFLFGGFAVVTALLKTRARVRSPLGVVLTILEGLSGLALMGSALPGAGSLETASRIAIAVAGLVAVSSTVHLLAVREQSRARESTEGKRLAAAIEYPVSGAPHATGDELPGSNVPAQPGVSPEPDVSGDPDVSADPGVSAADPDVWPEPGDAT